MLKVLGLFAYLTGSSVFSKYLLLPYIPGAGELLIFCGALAGAGLAFLWFNAHPAQVFMGDVGALALGGALGTLAVIRHWRRSSHVRESRFQRALNGNLSDLQSTAFRDK